VGFEPTIRFTRMAVFKTAAINPSATHPKVLKLTASKRGRKGPRRPVPEANENGIQKRAPPTRADGAPLSGAAYPSPGSALKTMADLDGTVKTIQMIKAY